MGNRLHTIITHLLDVSKLSAVVKLNQPWISHSPDTTLCLKKNASTLERY